MVGAVFLGHKRLSLRPPCPPRDTHLPKSQLGKLTSVSSVVCLCDVLPETSSLK